MTRGKRAETLEKLYNKFNTDKTGFLMPFFGVLANDNGGCRGPKKEILLLLIMNTPARMKM